jgi:hypothetical protein
MTPNQAKIVLTNPCSENWNSMQVDAIGRFCDSCQKSVIDFTSKSDDEIKSLLKNKQGEKLCGRFYINQVERIRIEIDQKILTSNIPFWQKFLVVVLVCFGQDFLGTDFVFAQTGTDSIPVIAQPVDSLDSIQLAEADTTLETSADSIQKPVRPKKDEPEFVLYYPVFPMVSGSFTVDDYPEWEIPLSINDKPKEDTFTSKMGISKTSQNHPKTPKHPKKKPSPPENALIADTGDRRKTRRS